MCALAFAAGIPGCCRSLVPQGGQRGHGLQRVRGRATKAWSSSLLDCTQPKRQVQPLTGQFSRQIRDATLVALPAAALRSTLCHDGHCSRAAAGARLDPVGVRHWQMHLAVSEQRRGVHGRVAAPCHIQRVHKPTWGGGTRQEETQGGKDMGNLPGCPSAPQGLLCHPHHPQKGSPNRASCPVLPSPVFWL